MTASPPAGWYADPEDPSQQRYWDGSAWTDHRVPGRPATDPAYGTPPTSQWQSGTQQPWSAGGQQPWPGHDQPQSWQGAPQGAWQGAPQGAPQGSWQGAPQGSWQQGPQTSGAAIAALVLGLLSIVACLGPITGIAAMIVGRNAKRDIESSGGRLEGSGMAAAGFWTGLVGTVLVVLAVLGIVALGIAASNSNDYSTY